MEITKSSPSLAKKLKSISMFFLKLALAVVLVGILFVRSGDMIIDSLRQFNYAWLIPAALLYFLHMVVCSYRWYRLTRVLNIDLDFKEAFFLSMQAYFFSLVVPGGAIGGDLVKIGVVSKRTRSGAKVEGAFTIFMDRIVGMIALFVTAIAVAVPAIGILMKAEIPGIELDYRLKVLGITGLFGLCAAGLLASVVIFFHRALEKIPPAGFLMRKVDKWTKGMVTRMTSATDVYRKNWQLVFKCTFWSIPLVHLMTVAVFICLYLGVGATAELPLLAIIAAVTIGNIAGLIPLAPSGIGLRDVVTVTILVAGGIAVGEAKTAQLLYTTLVILFNLLGGVFYILDPGRKQKQEIIKESIK